MDRAFLKYLTEIEKAYLVLPKALRIRVEAWVEKLASTGSNNVWKKHRNAYARLLLNMVFNRCLEDPFHVKPPDGPLPSFPMHLRNVNRHLLGPHESSFWREMYHKLQESYGLDGDKESGEQKFGDGLPNETFRHDGASLSYDGGSGGADSKAHAPFINVSREIQNLNLLIKEQAQRIRLLEDQLTDERTKHELQLQRLHYSHRIEVGRLHTELQQVRESVFQELGASPPRAAAASEEYHSRGLPSHDASFASVRLSSNAAHARDAQAMDASASVSTILFPEAQQHRAAAAGRPHAMGSTEAVCGSSGGDPNFMSAALHDITPRGYTAEPRAQHSAVYSSSGSSSSSGLVTQKWGLETPQTAAAAAAAVDDSDVAAERQEVEFLKYLDQFQTEIKNIDKNVSATSSPYRTI